MSRYNEQDAEEQKNNDIPLDEKEKPEPKKKYTGEELRETKTIYTGRGEI